MRRIVATLVVLVFAVPVGVLRADDKANPSGTWKWSTGGNRAREMTLKLKLDGGKLTGGFVGRDGKETAVEEPSFKGGEVSFKTTRERNGMKTTTTYKGKLSGDTIKGKVDVDRNGTVSSRDWEAKRSEN